MTEEKLFSSLLEEKIPFVLIGGTALAAYGSQRITIDTDIAVKTLDLDKIIGLLLSLGLRMVIGVDENRYPLFAESEDTAIAFSNRSDWGFLKFLSGDLEIDAQGRVWRINKRTKFTGIFNVKLSNDFNNYYICLWNCIVCRIR